MPQQLAGVKPLGGLRLEQQARAAGGADGRQGVKQLQVSLSAVGEAARGTIAGGQQLVRAPAAAGGRGRGRGRQDGTGPAEREFVHIQ